MPKLERIHSISDFSRLAHVWNELQQTSSSESVFLTWQWQYTWWKYYQNGTEGGRELLLLCIYDDMGKQLIGIAPFCVRTDRSGLGSKIRIIQFLGAGEPACSEYLDIISRQGTEQEVWETIIQYLASEYYDWDWLRLQDMAETSSSLSILSSMLAKYNLHNKVTKTNRCPYVLLPKSWDEFFNTKSSNSRYNLKRKTNKLKNKYEMSFRCYQHPDEVQPVFDKLIDLNRKRWNTKNIFTAFNNATFSAFHKEVITEFSRNRWLRIYTLEVGNQIIAALYCFQYFGKTYLYQSGFDQSWREFSPGMILINFAIGESIREGSKEFDFLRGTESHKYHWAKYERENVTVDIFNRGLINYSRIYLTEFIRKLQTSRWI